MKGLKEIVLIHDLKKQGLSISAIARKVGSDRKTVRKYLDRGLETPVYGPRQSRARVIKPYEHHLQERVQTFPDLRGARLLREIRELGYDGGYTAVTDLPHARCARPGKCSSSAGSKPRRASRPRSILPSSPMSPGIVHLRRHSMNFAKLKRHAIDPVDQW